eukprot:CAMPEP_0113971464 /NCGR_PEP_ID=MMETSP0011_2-20120614/12265_1 /TAXON_ID=101924 /ORGANISM="Rhodosorus marinus" /LENGTH=655 /DNA_ID=CAMNT_0000986991 /DNA_START=252 /DNA_END=2220 /DNA_ORIENTATION=+ /assembly_acc=CAM_ASM_000156
MPQSPARRAGGGVRKLFVGKSSPLDDPAEPPIFGSTVYPTVQRDSIERWLKMSPEDSLEPDIESERKTLLASVVDVLVLVLFGWILWLRWYFRVTAAKWKLAKCTTYEAWRTQAHELDRVEGNLSWKHEESLTGSVDYDLLRKRLLEFKRLYDEGDTSGLCYSIRSGMTREFAGLSSPELYSVCAAGGTKQIVEDYINVVAFLLEKIAQKHEELPGHEALTFFNETRHAYGRTALVLSGGGSMGVYHLGVVRVLLKQRLLPMVVSGTSAGSIVAALVGLLSDHLLTKMLEGEGVRHPENGDPITFDFFGDDSLFTKLVRVLRTGNLHDIDHLASYMESLFGDVTFAEAFKRSGRILNITVTPSKGSEAPLLLNYLTAPNVLVWSAVTASCALPGVFAPVELYSRSVSGVKIAVHPHGSQWADGSIRADVPLARLGELFNVNHFIVSQVNAHFVLLRNSWFLQTRVASLLKAEVKFRYWQLTQLGCVPGIVRALFPIFVQPYEGDVTITPELGLEDLLGLYVNPTVEYTARSSAAAEVQTFSKLEQIRNHRLLELALERCSKEVAINSTFRGDQNGEESAKVVEAGTYLLFLQTASTQALTNFYFLLPYSKISALSQTGTVLALAEASAGKKEAGDSEESREPSEEAPESSEERIC